MDLQQMIGHIQIYTNSVTPNTKGYSYSQQMPTVFPASIYIEYPGYKNIRDFVVKFSNNNYKNISIKHSHIVIELYNSVSANPRLFNDYYNFVIDVANNWEHIYLQNHPNIYFNNFTIGEVVEVMCYISTQEEINYPRVRGNDGYKRPFYSYLEGIYAAIASPTFTIQDAVDRCNAKVKFQILPNTNIPYHLI